MPFGRGPCAAEVKATQERRRLQAVATTPPLRPIGGGDMSAFRTLAAAGAALAIFAASPAAAQHAAQTAAAAQPATSAEARRADITAFRQQFLDVDRSYLPAARAEAVRRLAALEAEADRSSQAYFELELARIVALADNGHTVYFPGPRSRRYNRLAEV